MAMKGHMEDGKFHPHKQYQKGVHKSRDQSAKTQGIRMERIFQDDPNAVEKLEKKLEGLEKQKEYWKTVKKTIPRDYSNTEGDKKWYMPQLINANIRTVKKKIELIKNRQEKNIGLERKTTFKDGKKVFYYQEVERKAREFDLSLKQRKVIAKELSDNDFVILDQNPRWKLTHIVVDDGAEYYVFPDEDSALKFGIQSIRDTATDYIPEKDAENYDEWKDLDEEDLVDKIIEEASDFGQRSQLGAVARSVASYNGEYTELSDGTIAFRIS